MLTTLLIILIFGVLYLLSYKGYTWVDDLELKWIKSDIIRTLLKLSLKGVMICITVFISILLGILLSLMGQSK